MSTKNLTLDEIEASLSKYERVMTEGELRVMRASLDDMAIERYERPSRRPGVEPEVVVEKDGSEREIFYKGASPSQLEFQRVFFDRRRNLRTSKSVFAVAGGNRASKSVLVWCMCFMKYIRDYAKDGDVFWAIAPTYDKMRQDVHEWVWEYLPRGMFMGRVYTKELGFGVNATLELNLGPGRGTCKLVFKTEEMDLAHFEATAVTGIAWTEARNESLLTSMLMRLTDRRGFLLIDYLPCEGWHQERLSDNPDVYHMTLGMQQNAHNLPAGAIQAKMKELAHDPDAIDLRVYGKPKAMMGVVFKNFSRETYVDDHAGGHIVEPFPIPEYWPLYLGGDWGFRAPHAFGLGAVSPSGRIYLCAEDYRAERNVLQTVGDLWQMISLIRPLRLFRGFATSTEMFDKLSEWTYPRRVEKQRDWMQWQEDLEDNPIREHVESEFNRVLAQPCAIDDQVYQEHGSTGGSLSIEFWRAGLPIQRANKSIDAGVERMRSLFHHRRLLLFRTCPMIRRDFSSWKFRVKADGSVDPKDKYSEEYKHGCDGARYLVMQNPSFDSTMEVA